MIVTDEYVQSQIAKGKRYTIVFLIPGPHYHEQREAPDLLHAAHLRYLFSLQEEDKLLINGPLAPGSAIVGISIYNSHDLDEVRNWVEADPAVQAGRFIYEIYPWFGIPGGRLI